MKNWYIHGLNIIVLVAMSVFGLFALFGNAMSAGSSPSINFAVYTSFLLWGIFYGIQFLRKAYLESYLVFSFSNCFMVVAFK
ncbi:hypothetical protein [Salinicoccus sp. CNSTN-B1]